MKKTPLLAACLATLGLLIPSGLSAGAAPGPKARIFAEFDTNKNGVIDGDEVAAVRKAYAANPKGQFASYDKNADGKLDDAEMSGIKPPGQGGSKGGKKSGGKKN